MRPSIERVSKVLEKVKEERARLPHFSIFGDDNWGPSDKEIFLMEDFLKGLYHNKDNYENEEDQSVFDCALWLEDDSCDYFASDYETI